MRQEDMFDIETLFKHYSKNILKESAKQPLIESEVVINFDSPSNVKDREVAKNIISQKPKRFKTVVYYDDDPTLIPSSFQIAYSYKLVFQLDKIREDYATTQIDGKDDEPVDDDDIDKMIQQKLKQKKDNIKPKKQIIDMDAFYVDVFKKVFPSYTLNGKLNDLIRAGVLPIDDYKIYSITYSTQTDDKLLYRHLDKAIKQNKPAVSIPYGYEIGFECKDKDRAKTRAEVAQFALDFSKAMDGSIFKDTQYYKIKVK